MRALVIAHDHLSSPGLLTEGLVDAGFELTTLLVVPAERFAIPNVVAEYPELTDFDLLVPLGAPWSVYDAERIGTWVETEKEYLRAADAAGIPVLGVCFGGQLLASTYGGTVAKAVRPEIGLHDVDVGVDGDGPVESGPWFQWHFDGWTVPPGAREIARNDNASQAFTLRRNLAVQFHPELNSAILQGWLENGGITVARSVGIDPDELVEQLAGHADRAQQRTTRLVARFLDEVAFADVSTPGRPRGA